MEKEDGLGLTKQDWDAVIASSLLVFSLNDKRII